ncbi:recombinase family protein [Bariatricus sp. HCP28S3_D3]|uniref:recombinase family protein n=1 Tax=Bariatricus sp. HCP28S3_D3 TaxID=3438901 RepID=UPI003F89F0AD
MNQNIAIYIRTGNNEPEELSCSQQLIIDYIQEHSDFRSFPTKIYRDNETPDEHVNRLSFQKMLQDAENQELSCIIITDFSHLAISSVEQELLLSSLIDGCHTRVIAIKNHYDSSLENAALKKPCYKMAFLKQTWNEITCNPPPQNPIIQQLWNHPLLQEQAGEHGKNTAFSPYGYLYDPDSPCMMKIDSETAPVVQEIFGLYLSGFEVNHIARILTKKKIPTPGKRRIQMGYSYKRLPANDYWSSVSIRKILQNPVYIGDHIYRIPKMPKDLKKQAMTETPIPSGSVIHDHHPPLISKDDFEAADILLRCQEQLFRESRKQTETQKRKHPISLFRNNIFCAVCKRNMIHVCRNHDSPNASSAYVCCSTPKKLPNACSRILHPTEDIALEVKKAILEERAAAKAAALQTANGTHSPAYLAADKQISSQIAILLDQVMDSKSAGNDSEQNMALLRTEFSILRKQKDQLISEFTEPNKWLTRFGSLPEDFVLDRELVKHLVKRIEISPDHKCFITLMYQEEKENLLRFIIPYEEPA